VIRALLGVALLAVAVWLLLDGRAVGVLLAIVAGYLGVSLIAAVVTKEPD